MGTSQGTCFYRGLKQILIKVDVAPQSNVQKNLLKQIQTNPWHWYASLGKHLMINQIIVYVI